MRCAMQVTIERKTEKEGLIFKKDVTRLFLTVVFSEEEKFAINQAGIKNHIFYSKRPWKDGLPDEILNCYVKDLFKGQRQMGLVYNFVDANEEEEKIREGLTALKSQIEATKKPKGKETYEL
jgi:hypothetical protein